MNKVNSNMGEV